MAIRSNYYIAGGSGSSGGGTSSGVSSKFITAQKNAVKAKLLELKAKNGGIQRPEDYDIVNDLFLKDYLDEEQLAAEYWSNQNAKFDLVAKQDENKNDLFNITTQKNNVLNKITERNYDSPLTFIEDTASLQNDYMKALDETIKSRKENDISVDDLEKEYNKNVNVVDALDDLRARLASGDKSTTANYAVLMDTLANGEVTNMRIVPINILDDKEGYQRTTATYAGVPVYGKPTLESDIKAGGLVDVIHLPGQDFVQSNVTTIKNPTSSEGELTAENNKPKPIFVPNGKQGGYNGTQTSMPDISEHIIEPTAIKLNGNVDNFAPDSVIKSSSDSYFYKGKDRWYATKGLDDISKFTGKPKDILEKETKSISNKQLRTIGSLLDEQGNYQMLPSLDFASSKPSSSFGTTPSAFEYISNRQSVVSPQPSIVPQASVSAGLGTTIAPQTPRKEPTMKTDTGLTGMVNKAKGFFNSLIK